MRQAILIPPSGSIGDHGLLSGLLDDDHTQYALLAGRLPGQSLLGSNTAALGRLDLAGSGNIDSGILGFNSPMQIDVDFSLSSLAQVMDWNTTIPSSGASVTSMILSRPDITIDAGTFIIATVRDAGIYRQTALPGFAVHTLFLGQPTLTTATAGVRPNQTFVYSAQPRMQNVGAGNLNAFPIPSVFGYAFTPILDTRVSGDTLVSTLTTGLNVGPTHNTVAGTTINYGTIRGVHMRNPAVVIFGTQAGTELMVSYRGLDVDPISFGGNVEKIAVRSAMVAATNTYFLRNVGGAQSDFGGGFILDAGLVQVVSNTLGLSLGDPGARVQIVWNGSALEFDPIVGDDMRTSFATNIHTITSSSVSEDSAINFDYPKGAFGEGGAPGNNKYRFVANAESITLAGGFAQFLLTQLANDTINAGLSQYFGWSINAPTPTIGTGSIVDAGALLIGGNPAAGTNRYGLLIIANPSGGTINRALRVTGSAGSFFDGEIEFDTDIHAQNASGPILRDLASSSTVPTVSHNRAQPTSGMGGGLNTTRIFANNVAVMEWDEDGDIHILETNGILDGAATGASAMINRTVSATVAGLLVNKSDNNTGFGQGILDNISAVCGALEALRIEDPADLAATETSLWLFDDDNNTMEQVTVGAADSGGGGFKVLRIPN